ncbi:MAG: hypothetical protein ABSB56_07825 [Nitrososphaerales archaeon]
MSLPQGESSGLLVVVVLLLATSLAFAVLAYEQPVKSIPAYPSQCVPATLMNTNPCNTYLLPDYFQQYAIDTAAFSSCWFFRSYVGIAEGLVVMALLLPVLAMKRLDFSWLHTPIAPRFPTWLFVPLALAGASVFALFAAADATYYDVVFSRTLVNTIAVYSSYYFGLISFGTWLLTIAVLTLRRGLVGAMKVFGLPAILFLEATLLVFLPNAMPVHITEFTDWSVGAIDLISNWLVLMVASFLFVYAWTYRRLGLR